MAKVIACIFCGQDHPQRSEDTFLGLPIAFCPNLPSNWVAIDDPNGLLITEVE